MRYLVIVGGQIYETDLLKKLLAETVFDHIIAADSGLNWAYRLEIIPDQMLGDFDSAEPKVVEHYRKLQIPVKVYPTRKDYTDSELALWAALDLAKAGDEIWMLGGIGSRMDHTLGNVFMLYEPLKKGVKACLLDGLNEIRLLQGGDVLLLNRREQQQYLSVLPFLGSAKGIDLEGMAYPLQDYTLEPGKCIGISNEIEKAQAKIRLKEGYLLVIRSTNDTPK